MLVLTGQSFVAEDQGTVWWKHEAFIYPYSSKCMAITHMSHFLAAQTPLTTTGSLKYSQLLHTGEVEEELSLGVYCLM